MDKTKNVVNIKPGSHELNFHTFEDDFFEKLQKKQRENEKAAGIVVNSRETLWFDLMAGGKFGCGS